MPGWSIQPGNFSKQNRSAALPGTGLPLNIIRTFTDSSSRPANASIAPMRCQAFSGSGITAHRVQGVHNYAWSATELPVSQPSPQKRVLLLILCPAPSDRITGEPILVPSHPSIWGAAWFLMPLFETLRESRSPWSFALSRRGLLRSNQTLGFSPSQRRTAHLCCIWSEAVEPKGGLVIVSVAERVLKLAKRSRRLAPDSCSRSRDWELLRRHSRYSQCDASDRG